MPGGGIAPLWALERDEMNMTTEVKLKAKIEKVVIKQMYDSDADTSYLDQDEFKDRQQAYERGDFFYIGISADATILTSYDGKSWLINTITSGGLWGIESDSNESYLESVRMEEENELKDILLAFGFSQEEITGALDASETVTDY